MYKIIIVSLLFVGFICQISSADEIKKEIDLAKEMKASEAALLGMRLSTEIGVSQGKVSKERLNCLNATDSLSLVEIYATIVRDNLSEEEIDTALKFYRSSAGEKYTEVGFIKIRQGAGQREHTQFPSFSKNEQKTVVDFMATEAANKLWKNNLLGSESTQKKVNPYLRKIYESCNPNK